jgi:hypothetical protein
MTTLEQTQQEWVEQYADKMMTCWQKWQGPLGIDEGYKKTLTRQLAACFAEPLKRDLIERTY